MSKAHHKTESEGSDDEKKPPSDPWYKQPLVLWTIVIGLVAAWRFIVPVPFNIAVYHTICDVEPSAWLIEFAPYPEMTDDRIIICMCAWNTLFWALVNLLPNFIHRRFVRWNCLSLSATLLIAVVYVYVPVEVWLTKPQWWLTDWLRSAYSGVPDWGRMAIIYILAIVLAILATGLRWWSSPVSLSPRLQRWLVGVAVSVSLSLIFYLIPFACGTYLGQIRSLFAQREPQGLFLLHMKNPSSPLHEELVDVLVRTTDYLVVRLSSQVPHPNSVPGSPTTLPAPEKTSEFHVDFSLPILIRRDSVECLTFVFSPVLMKKSFRTLDEKLGVTTQRTLEVERAKGGGYKFRWK